MEYLDLWWAFGRDFLMVSLSILTVAISAAYVVDWVLDGDWARTVFWAVLAIGYAFALIVFLSMAPAFQ